MVSRRWRIGVSSHAALCCGHSKLGHVLHDRRLALYRSTIQISPFLRLMQSDRTLSYSSVPETEPSQLADFRTNRRVLLLCALALPIGAIGAVVAKALLWLMAVFTN